MTLQVTLQPMLLKKPACRLVQTGETFESVLTQLLADTQRNGDACEARIVDLVEEVATANEGEDEAIIVGNCWHEAMHM